MTAGEGTFQQIYEHFGNETDVILTKLRFIFITHKHGDHMFGAFKIIKERHIMGVKEPLVLFVPSLCLKWFAFNLDTELPGHSVVLVDCDNFNPRREKIYDTFIDCNLAEDFVDVPIESSEETSNRVKEYRLALAKGKLDLDAEIVSNVFELLEKEVGVSIYAIEVLHCEDSFGVILKGIEDDWQIAYSGDCRPSNNFLNFARKSSVIIHEATFSDDLAQDALAKYHTTFQEAIDLSKQNETAFVVLTHFSPRFVKTTLYNEEYAAQGVIVAHDFMTISLNDLQIASVVSNQAVKALNEADAKKII